ncbi:MAG: YfhO family protein, partial [Bacteroidales bacterium]|nr:YfhO family protein [Bacteroidales bacterium]
NVALIDKRFEEELTALSSNLNQSNTIILTDYQPNHLKYNSQTHSNQLAIFSEIYYNKGWNAYIDGELKPHFRANYTLRAMIIPEGEHLIEFKFEPTAYYTGEKIALVGSLLLILSFSGIIARELKYYFGGKKEE